MKLDYFSNVVLLITDLFRFFFLQKSITWYGCAMDQACHHSDDLQKQDVSNPNLGYEDKLRVHVDDEGKISIRLVKLFPVIGQSVELRLIEEF